MSRSRLGEVACGDRSIYVASAQSCDPPIGSRRRRASRRKIGVFRVASSPCQTRRRHRRAGHQETARAWGCRGSSRSCMTAASNSANVVTGTGLVPTARIRTPACNPFWNAGLPEITRSISTQVPCPSLSTGRSWTLNPNSREDLGRGGKFGDRDGRRLGFAAAIECDRDLRRRPS